MRMSSPGPVSRPKTGNKDRDVELAKANARLNGIIFSAMDAIITVDGDQRIVLFNPAAEKMFGISAPEVLGQDLSRFIPEQFRSAHAQRMSGFGRTGVSTRRMGALGMISGLRANGEEFPIEASISQVEINGEKLFTVILRDVSERARDQSALRESQTRKAAILESALDCILSIDKEGKIIEANAATERVFGYQPDEMVGGDMADLIVPPEMREAHRRGMAHYLATGEGRVLGKRIEMSALHRDGRRFPVELTISAFRLNGEPCFTGTLRDITHRKHAQEKLHTAMEQLEKAKIELEERVEERTIALRQTIGDLEAFSYSLSHDLRAPLRALRKLPQVVLQDYGSHLPPEGADLLKKVISQASRMDRLVVDLLAFSRVSLQPIEFRMIEPEKLINEILLERPEFHSPQVHVHVERPLLPMRGHPASLTQCLTNLLSNALKFVAPGVGPQVRIYTEPVGHNVRLWVHDNGIGIAEEAQQRIFEVFQRLHNATEYEGSGIGLAIVRKSVLRMGGTVGLESELGKGSRFWIELPGASETAG